LGACFWAAAFFVGGDKQTAAELAQMKGQMVAVEQASIAKSATSNSKGSARPAPDLLNFQLAIFPSWG
jgi:hypothetical protein